MYLIVVYDIKVERVNNVKKFLRQNLFWVQNSVFEGEVTESEFNYITNGLKKVIDEEKDSIIIYKFRTEDELNKTIIGIEKSPIGSIL
ncbi:MAG: CRISPR-associated endonuclease Cas2 [Methanobrevibacter sp.]|nr:CRISPR-associated endonuclease Cas2 [Candidatus Methanovirga aequatorialis]